VLERVKSSVLPNENFREFFLWRGEFCVFKTGIPGGPDRDRPRGTPSSGELNTNRVSVAPRLLHHGCNRIGKWRWRIRIKKMSRKFVSHFV